MRRKLGGLLWIVARAAGATWCLLGAGTAWADPIESFTEPFRKIDVAPAEPGTVANIAVTEGDRVERGQVLATLDCDVLLISLQSAKANAESRGKISSALAERDLRARRVERLKVLRQRENASQEEVDRAEADAAIAEASLLAVREQHALDELEYKKTEALIERRTVRSPIDGLVTRIYREEREFVSPNSPAVLTVVQLDRLRMTFSVPTISNAAIAVGQKAPIYFPESDEKAEGTVEYVAPVAEAESGTVRVKILLDNDREHYRCGARCVLDLDALTPSPGRRGAAGRAPAPRHSSL